MPPARRISSVDVAAPAAPEGLRAIVFDHLVDAHAGRYHGVHVGLGVYVKVQDRTPFLPLRPRYGFLDVTARFHRTSGEPVGRRHLLVARPRDRRLRVATVVEELLPLAHHAEVAVVEDGDLDVQAEVPDSGELLNVHLEA